MRFEHRMNKIKEQFMKRWIIWGLVILGIISLFSPIIINLVATYPVIQVGRFEWLYPNPEKISENAVWVPALASIYGAILGGVISGFLTLGGVLLSNKHQENERKVQKNDRLTKILLYFHYEVKDNKAIIDRASRFIRTGPGDTQYPIWDFKTEAFEKYFLDLIELMDSDEIHFVKETYDEVIKFKIYGKEEVHVDRNYLKIQVEDLNSNLASLSQKLKDKESEFNIKLQ